MRDYNQNTITEGKPTSQKILKACLLTINWYLQVLTILVTCQILISCFLVAAIQDILYDP